MSVPNEQYVSEYLARLDYHGSRTPCIETLRTLQRQHVTRVLFENLDLLQDGFTPNLEQDFLFDKIVRRNRGGVCYELNTSFYQLLCAMGFSAHQISGAVKPGESMFAHVATLVHLEDGDYIADVGFADSYLPPLKVGSNPAGEFGGNYFSLRSAGENTVQIIRHTPEDEEKLMYTVALTPRNMSDYFPQFQWASAMGNTVFSAYPICFSNTPERQVTLRSQNLTVVCNDQIMEDRPIAPGEETERCLREYFNLP